MICYEQGLQPGCGRHYQEVNLYRPEPGTGLPLKREYVHALRKLLEDNNILQRELAEEMQVSQPQLSRWMRTRVGFSLSSRARVEGALVRILRRRRAEAAS